MATTTTSSTTVPRTLGSIESEPSVAASITASFNFPEPFALSSWIDANLDKLKPPVSNLALFMGNDFILQAVAGPNTRNDYHINQTEEWFYQIRGKLLLKVVENGDQFRDIEIDEGEMYLLKGNTPHSPIRKPGTLGLVMERQRGLESIDRLRWYCPNKAAHQDTPSIIREESFLCDNIEQSLKVIIQDWQTNEKSRECKLCGAIAPPY
ncbi:3-hydroxyanthranilate 3,4-dioxygenase [Xylogone sp. PMI_703]|nr:3-hydroxyanthranilate 3,4-dioxygenase [Xylogone sp. PMI_703]